MENKIKELINKLNYYTEQYDKGEPLISDKEWDEMYFELVKLEKETSIILSNSPTQKISYTVVNELKKVEHNHPMLSLDKTKEIEDIKSFLNDKTSIAMCKMDGLTCSLRYLNGKLISAETRGNGIIGEDILHNAFVISSIPKRIKYKDELIVDGEIICKKNDFEKFSKDYKNPRNFASGSIRLLDAKECSKRKLTFVAWNVIKGFNAVKTFHARLSWLEKEGFTIVPTKTISDFKINSSLLNEAIDNLKNKAIELNYPIDGIVFKFNNIEYANSLGRTEHHFKDAIAYKFYDESYQTELIDIEWTMGRTGVLTPVAIFNPIEIEDTEVSRASLHNLSIMESLWPNAWESGLGLEVYKANQIIPQIREVFFKKLSLKNPYEIVHSIEIPVVCPYCGKPTEIKENNGVKTLWCTNPNCESQLINKLDHYCGKKGLDIKGLSKATLEKLINWNWLFNISDLYNLKNHKDEWIQKSGFGEKSVSNILNAIEEKKNCSLESFICSLGIPLIGITASKALAKQFKTWEAFISAVDNKYSFCELPNFGIEMELALLKFNYDEAKSIANLLTFKESKEENIKKNLEGINVVITGKLIYFKNRAEMTAAIEAKGGKVVGSVSSKTNYLINNDINSNSAKNQKAKELNIPILTEEDFIKNFLDI